MRNCNELVRILRKDYPEVIEFIQKAAFRTENNVFVGIREEEITLYYRNAKIVSISYKENHLEFVTHRRYIGKDDDKKYVLISFEELKDKFDDILKNIDETKPKEERSLQQWIVNMNNISEDAEWYYLDMEYNTQGEYTGRFDLIAISKYPLNGKYRVALIELKVGLQSIGGSAFEIRNRGTVKSDIEYEYEVKNRFAEVFSTPGAIYKKDNKNMNYGSGMVGHIADYLRYLERDYYNYMLRHEICCIIAAQRELGVIPRHFDCLSCIEYGDIATVPEVKFACFDSYINGRDNNISIVDIKKEVYDSIFTHHKKESKSDCCLCEMICETDIKEFIENKDNFINDRLYFDFEKEICGTKYLFGFYFINGMNEKSWNWMKQ